MQESLIKSSFKYCEEIAKNHYENFPVASFLVPKNKRKYIFSIYAFARAADDFADEPAIEGGKEKRLVLLDEWNGKLRDCYKGKAYDPIFIALSRTVEECKVPIETLEKVIRSYYTGNILSIFPSISQMFFLEGAEGGNEDQVL